MKKWGLRFPTTTPTLCKEDFIAILKYLLLLRIGEEEGNFAETDDIDHLGNRRVRSVGELLANQFNIGLARMARIIRERMSLQEPETLTPYDFINARTISAVIQSFFGSSQLSQFMDQTNPAGRADAQAPPLGPRARRSDARPRRVRGARRAPHPLRPDVPDRDPGRPEHRPDLVPLDLRPGQRVRVPRDPLPQGQGRGRVDGQIEFLAADQEDKYIIAQANAPLDKKRSVSLATTRRLPVQGRVPA